MSHLEKKDGSHKPLFGKSNSRHGDSSTSNGNSYNNGTQGHSTSGGELDLRAQNLKNEYNMESSYANQQQMLEVKLRTVQTRLKFLSGIVVGGFVILIVLCGACFLKMHHDVTYHTHKPTLSAQMAAILEEGVCVSCEDFRLGANAEQEDVLNKYIDESSGAGRSARCCADTGAELLELLTLFIERKFRLELAKGTVPGTLAQAGKDGVIPPMKPAAHLMMDQQDPVPQIPGRQQMIKRWRHIGDMTFLVGGAAYDDGRIVVPMDGYYFVYCHISFSHFLANEDESYGGQSDNLSVYLYRYNILYDTDGEEILARNSITKCESSSKNIAEYVISLGAVFKLRRQDQILIKVSDVSTLDPSPKNSYFGFFKI